jgi:hypothetical protein
VCMMCVFVVCVGVVWWLFVVVGVWFCVGVFVGCWCGFVFLIRVCMFFECMLFCMLCFVCAM